MRVLTAVASKHGATVEVAQAIAQGLLSRGIEARVSEQPDRIASVDAYDAVIVGSAVYAGHWLPAARDFIDKHGEALRERRVWLFSSGPVGTPDPKPEGDPADVEDLVASTGAVAHRVFAGRVERKRLGFAERAIVRALRVSDGDFRDWQAIDAFAGEIAGGLEDAGSPAHRERADGEATTSSTGSGDSA